MILASAKLDVDVLAIVCGFLTNISDVSSFALTCSSFRPVGVQRLLSMHPIDLTGDLSIRRFHSFLFANTPARAPHVRALHIDLGHEEDHDSDEECDSPRQIDVHPADPSLIVDILASCPRLEHIFLVFNYSPESTNDPRIIRAITALPNLRSLSLSERCADSYKLISELRAPLRELGLPPTSPMGDHWHPAALAQHISHLAPTLAELSLSQFTVDPAEIRTMLARSSQPVSSSFRCPAVRSFTVGFVVGTPLLAPLQRLFPALDRELSIFHGPFTSFKAPEDKYARMRTANRRAQDRLLAGSGAGAGVGPWTKLDRVACDALVFYVLGLRCPVRLAMLDVAPGRDSAYTTHYAAAALREDPVPRLKLSLMLDDGLGALDGLFDSPGVARALTHLTLCLVYDGAEPGPEPPSRVPRSLMDVAEAAIAADVGPPACPSWGDLLAKLHSFLEPLRNLTHLRVVVHSDAVENENADDAVAFARALRRCRPDANSDPSEKEGAGEEAAAMLVRALPSLQYVFLTVSGYLPHPEDVRGEEGYLYSGEYEPTYEHVLWNVSRTWRVAAPRQRQPVARAAGKRPQLEDAGDREEQEEAGLVELHEDVAETIIRAEELVLSKKDEVGTVLPVGAVDV